MNRSRCLIQAMLQTCGLIYVDETVCIKQTYIVNTNDILHVSLFRGNFGKNFGSFYSSQSSNRFLHYGGLDDSGSASNVKESFV